MAQALFVKPRFDWHYDYNEHLYETVLTGARNITFLRRMVVTDVFAIYQTNIDN